MKTTVKFALLVAVLTLTAWIGQVQPSEAAYPACWNLRDCSSPGAHTLCWNVNYELAFCTCLNGWWQCSTAGYPS